MLCRSEQTAVTEQLSYLMAADGGQNRRKTHQESVAAVLNANRTQTLTDHSKAAETNTETLKRGSSITEL